MKSSLRRRIAAVALVLAAPAAAGCTNGFGAQTDQVYQPAVGTNDKTGDVFALNALIVSADDGSGTLAVSLLNDGDQDDALVSVTGSNLTSSFSPISLPPGELVDLARSGEVSVTGPKVEAGNFVSIELAFQSGLSKKLLIPVVRNNNAFADVPLPSEPPNPGAASATQQPSGAASPSASPSQ
ncbi:MAG TPA: hypothetical protein VFO98_01545 [Marmoricola sp.]|nr:hypothetical protein [Marmoricola sp.]